MSWGEFTTLLAGLNGNTPLGAVVSIRSEKDPKVIKNFTREQKQIYNKWKFKQAKTVTREEYDKAMKQFDAMFKSMGQSNTNKK